VNHFLIPFWKSLRTAVLLSTCYFQPYNLSKNEGSGSKCLSVLIRSENWRTSTNGRNVKLTQLMVAKALKTRISSFVLSSYRPSQLLLHAFTRDSNNPSSSSSSVSYTDESFYAPAVSLNLQGLVLVSTGADCVQNLGLILMWQLNRNELLRVDTPCDSRHFSKLTSSS
jgi:hypothetical protein